MPGQRAVSLLFSSTNQCRLAVEATWHATMKFATTSLALFAGLAVASGHQPKAPQIIDLGGSEWTLSSKPPNVTVPGFVPSHVHLDLLKAGVIDDPLV